jgi:SAM-dependent methyltransferase
MERALPVRVGFGVGLVAGCVLALQVLLTRFFSASLFYHFSFLSISLALLGAGAGAIAVYIRPDWFDRRPLEEQLARWSLGFALLLLAIPLVLARIKFGTTDEVTGRFVGLLALTSALTTVIFAAGGTVIALAVRGYTRTIYRLYAFDLVGAAIGAVAVVPLMWAIAVPTLLVALSPVAAGAALLFSAGGAPRVARAGVAVLALGAAGVAIAAATTVYEPKPANLANVDPVFDKWTPLSRVVAYGANPGQSFAPLFFDRGGAPVAGYQRGEHMPNWRDLALGPHSLAWVFGGTDRSLLIGPGGGRDILNALSSGVKRVDAVELNAAIRDAADDGLREFSGSPYTLPGVHTRIGDGRTALVEGDADYDVVHLGFADTLSAGSAQAFTLSENNLYTVEAFDEYLDHLRPNGVLAVSRPRRLVGDEGLRVTVLALETLRERGVEHPERNVVVVMGRDILNELYATTLARKRPWTQAELARLRVLARERGKGVAFAPGGPYQYEWADLAKAPSARAFCEGYRLDVCAPTDDKPFFFQMRRLSSLGADDPGYIYAAEPFLVLIVTFVILAVLSLLLVAAPLLLTAREDRPPVMALGFFAAIGLGFLTLEIVLIQRFVLFLGFPTYALSVVLFSLLLWTGAGSLLAGRVTRPRTALTVALGTACVLIAASAFLLHPVLAALIDLPFAARVAITVALLAPVGIALGMAMPLGLTRLAALHPRGIAWAWGVNGIASVVASAGAITVAIVAGFPTATLVALACYLAALAHVRFGEWADHAARERSRDAAARGRRAMPEPVDG